MNVTIRQSLVCVVLLDIIGPEFTWTLTPRFGLLRIDVICCSRQLTCFCNKSTCSRNFSSSIVFGIPSPTGDCAETWLNEVLDDDGVKPIYFHLRLSSAVAMYLVDVYSELRSAHLSPSSNSRTSDFCCSRPSSFRTLRNKLVTSCKIFFTLLFRARWASDDGLDVMNLDRFVWCWFLSRVLIAWCALIRAFITVVENVADFLWNDDRLVHAGDRWPNYANGSFAGRTTDFSFALNVRFVSASFIARCIVDHVFLKGWAEEIAVDIGYCRRVRRRSHGALFPNQVLLRFQCWCRWARRAWNRTDRTIRAKFVALRLIMFRYFIRMMQFWWRCEIVQRAIWRAMGKRGRGRCWQWTTANGFNHRTYWFSGALTNAWELEFLRVVMLLDLGDAVKAMLFGRLALCILPLLDFALAFRHSLFAFFDVKLGSTYGSLFRVILCN